MFSCNSSLDIFGYCGDVVFPALVLGQLVTATDNRLLVKNEEEATSRHGMFVRQIQASFAERHQAPNENFNILHAVRISTGLGAVFRLWNLTYTAVSNSWSDQEIVIFNDQSGVIVALGSGAASFEARVNHSLLSDPQGRTSRAVFWAFCDALKSKDDPLSGGAPQLIGIYRAGGPKVFGVVFGGQRHFIGLHVPNNVPLGDVEWRDEYFQRVDGVSMRVMRGAQRHGRV